jgi:hypothetical protein
MPQSKILLDTNTYLRLAKSINPLLDVPFGEENYCLYVLKELDGEFSSNRRLRTSFHWVDEDEYADNRKKRLSLSRKDKRSIEITVDFLKQHKIDNRLSVSEVDILCLAYAQVLGIPVVTDDMDMIEVAAIFSIKHMKTLDLMRLMLDSGHIDMDRVRQIVAYWEYISDKPASFRKEYISIFYENPP